MTRIFAVLACPVQPGSDCVSTAFVHKATYTDWVRQEQLSCIQLLHMLYRTIFYQLNMLTQCVTTCWTSARCPHTKTLLRSLKKISGRNQSSFLRPSRRFPLQVLLLHRYASKHFHAKTTLLNLSCLTFSNAALNYRMYNAALRCVDMMTSCMSCLNCQLHRAVLENS